MTTCIYINHSMRQCGVYQYGKRVFDILKNSTINKYMYFEVNSFEEYMDILRLHPYDCIMYNYNAATLSWLTNSNIQRSKKNICIYHEFTLPVSFDVYMNTDCTFNDNGCWYGIPRPLFENNDLTSHIPEIVTIGSFGLALPQKGFERMIKYVNSEFDNAIIRLHIPNSEFGDPSSMLKQGIINNCESILRKDGVKLSITSDFLDDQQLLNFLNSNTINVFMYDQMSGRGLSSVIDYAISVERPIAISDSDVFRHIYSDEICLSKTSIKNIIEKGNDYTGRFRSKWSNKNLIEKIDSIINSNL